MGEIASVSLALRSQPRLQISKNVDLWLVSVIILYIGLGVVYAILGLWRYQIFRAGVDDGIFTQIVNSAFSGFSSTQEGANHLLVHFSPILIVAFPFVRLLNGAQGLIVLQALATAAVVFPVWGMAQARLPKSFALVVTLVAAIYPPLSGEGVGDFHELAFAPVLSACLVWALDRRLWQWAVAAALLLACVKEDQFVALTFIGGFVAISSRRDAELRRCGIRIALIGLGFALFYFGVLRPLINAHFPYWSFHFYQWWWFPPTPDGFVEWNSPARLQYLVAALSPLAFLPLMSRRYFLFALPGLAEVLLSHEAITLFIGLHYSATWSGYMLCAFADGAGWLYAKRRLVAKGLVLAALVLSAWTSEHYSPIIPAYFLGRTPTNDDAVADRALQSIPHNATIYTDYGLFAHLGMDPQASINLQNQAFLVFDLEQDATAWESAAVRTKLANHEYRTVLHSARVVVLRRKE